MNRYEKEMLEILKRGKEHYGYVSVKAEFEAEGTRIDEFLRLLEITRRADLDVALKIGGCEAIRDLIEAKQFGVEHIIAPMIETPYALSKYIAARNKIYSSEEMTDMEFLFNLETITAYHQLDDIAALAASEKSSLGVVFGRVDFTGSNNMSRDDINTPAVQEYSFHIAEKCKEHNLTLVVGGGVSIEALPALSQIHDIHLTRFETRKIVWDADALSLKNIEKGLCDAVRFELLWLQNKQSYYQNIANEDDSRIQMLQTRCNELEAKVL
ncbi:MAG: aldolase [Methylocystaceae bacterium]|nr:aldolase [Methylocystaceae bacterium]